MPYKTTADAPEKYQKNKEAAAMWVKVFNSAWDQYEGDPEREAKAHATASAAVNKKYDLGEVALGEWDTAHINDLPDSSFAYIEPGGEKDETGKTTPRSKRHLPYKNAGGKPDAAHVRNALARLDQTDIPAAAKASARRKLVAAAKDAGVEVSDTKKASERRFTIVMPAPVAFGDDKHLARGEVIREGSWIYGGETMDVTADMLRQAVKNLETHKRDVMLDYNHGSRLGKTPEEQKRAGDLVALEVVDVDGVTALYGTFKPTDEAAGYLAKGEYKYLSAEFDEDYFHPEDKDWIGMYLQAVALTNRPFIEGMAPITLMGEGVMFAQGDAAYTGNVSVSYECDNEHDVGSMLGEMMGTIKDKGLRVTGSSASKYKNSPMMMQPKKPTEAPRLARDVFFAEVANAPN